MIISAQNILFLTLSICVAVLTILLSWSLYYVLISVKEIRGMVLGVKKRIDAIIEFVDKTKEKAETGAEAVTTLSKAVIEVVEYVKEKRKAKSEK